MMHVDKNADDHVMDQNVDRILREIAYVPLGGGIRSKRSSCKFFFFLVSTRFAYLEDDGSWLIFSEDQGFLGFDSCFQRKKRFWILAHVFRGLGFWILAHVFRGPRVLGLWLIFSEDQRF